MPVLFPDQHSYDQTWTDFFVKLFGGLTFVGVFFIALVWYRQDTFLYCPQTPEQYPEDN